MTIGIVILNWNTTDDTISCLESLTAMRLGKGMDVAIAVVDNASSEGSVQQLRKYIQKHGITLIENTQNLGFSGGNNTGIKKLLSEGCDYILLLNNDTLVEPSFLTNLVTASEKHNAGVAGPKIWFAKGYEYHKTYKQEELGKVIWYAGGTIDWDNMYCSHRGVDEVDRGQYDQAEGTAFVTGCCLLIKRDVIERIGMLDDAYFAYLEDVDYCMRAKKAGFTLWYEPSSTIWHKNAQSSGKSGSDLHVYYQTRNRMIFGMKYAPLRTKIALMRESTSLLTKGKVQRSAVFDFYLHRYGPKP